MLAESAQTVRDAIAAATNARDLLCDLGARVIAIGDRYRFLEAHPELRERTLSGAGDDREGADPLHAYLSAAQERGEIRPDVPVDWMLTTMRGLAVVAMFEMSAGRMTVEDAGRTSARRAPRRSPRPQGATATPAESRTCHCLLLADGPVRSAHGHVR